MINLLLLKDPSDQDEHITALFSQAGYNVARVNDLASCCRQLMNTDAATYWAGQSAPAVRTDAASNQTQAVLDHCEARDETPKGIAVVAACTSDLIQAGGKLPALPALILSLARRLSPGWRLTMRDRFIEAPNGRSMHLTSLEFSFIKVFAFSDPGEPVSRRKIVEEFGEDYLSYDQNRLDTLVRRLRKKTELELQTKLPLNTVRVKGFAFCDVLMLDM